VTRPNSTAAGASKKRLAVWALRLAGSALVLAVVFHFVPFERVREAASRIPVWMWLAALLGFFAGHVVAALKWRMLIGPGVSPSRAVQAHLAGLAANLCLPGVAGGDVVRAGMAFGQAHDKARLAVGSVVDRVIDTLGLALIAALSALVAFGPRLPQGLVFAVGLTGLVGAVAGVLVLVWLARRPVSESAPTGKLGKVVAKLAALATEFARRPGLLFACLVLSMGVQLVFIAINIAFADAAGMQTPASAWSFAWATAKIIAIAPVSLGGLGVREASMAGLLAPFGAEAGKVIAVGLVWQTVLYASGGIAAVAQLFWKSQPRDAQADVPAAGMAGRTQ
jgi:uncharacterized membrane protein YbhN (UPF0104 family)